MPNGTETLIALIYDQDALDGMSGGSVTFTVHSRGGVADAEFQPRTITANIGAGG